MTHLEHIRKLTLEAMNFVEGLRQLEPEFNESGSMNGFKVAKNPELDECIESSKEALRFALKFAEVAVKIKEKINV